MLFHGLDNNMEKNILEQYRLHLNRIYENSQDSHNIYTPLELCEEMINSLSDLNDDKSILVISNLEFLIVLKSKIKLDNVHYTTSCDIKKQVAISLGLNVNNIYNLEYNKEINLEIEKNMKFDYVIMNPPYNPNSLWKKFVLKGIDLLNDNGQMVAIHPDQWRTSSTHTKLCVHLKEHISELHINDYEIWKEQKVAIKTDWYLYNKQKQNNCNITYSNGDKETLNLKNIDKILRFSKKSIQYQILNKIISENDNGIIFEKGFNELYKPENHNPNGKYKQCGGSGNGTGWTKGNFILTDKPSKYQFENKIVMSYAGKPRATYFKTEEQVGCLRANILLTDNINSNPESICLLLNSKLFFKIYLELLGTKPWIKNDDPTQVPTWFYRHINIEKCYFTNDEELYKHFGLTQEEINWIEQ